MKHLFLDCSSVYIKKCSSAMFVCLSFMAGTAQAGTIFITDPNPVTKAYSSDRTAVETTVPITSLAPSLFNYKLIQSEYPTWTVKSGTTSPGFFFVSNYKSYFSTENSIGGTEIKITYYNGTALPKEQKLQWVQFISTNVPLGGISSPYIDPRPNDDNLPFYLTNAELPSLTSGNSLTFIDNSKRSISTLKTTDPLQWRANLFLVEWDGAKTITPLDGLQWGWNMTSTLQRSGSSNFVTFLDKSLDPIDTIPEPSPLLGCISVLGLGIILAGRRNKLKCK